MSEFIRFDNTINYQVFSPLGEVVDSGFFKNAVGPREKDYILRSITVPHATYFGNIGGINVMEFRCDGSSILGSFEQWYMSGTSYSTRFNAATFINSVQFNATYVATANTTVKAIAMHENAGYGPTTLVIDVAYFYSTLMNVTVGSGGAITVQWTVNAV